MQGGGHRGGGTGAARGKLLNVMGALPATAGCTITCATASTPPPPAPARHPPPPPPYMTLCTLCSDPRMACLACTLCVLCSDPSAACLLCALCAGAGLLPPKTAWLLRQRGGGPPAWLPTPPRSPPLPLLLLPLPLASGLRPCPPPLPRLLAMCSACCALFKPDGCWCSTSGGRGVSKVGPLLLGDARLGCWELLWLVCVRGRKRGPVAGGTGLLLRPAAALLAGCPLGELDATPCLPVGTFEGSEKLRAK